MIPEMSTTLNENRRSLREGNVQTKRRRHEKITKRRDTEETNVKVKEAREEGKGTRRTSRC